MNGARVFSRMRKRQVQDAFVIHGQPFAKRSSDELYPAKNDSRAFARKTKGDIKDTLPKDVTAFKNKLMSNYERMRNASSLIIYHLQSSFLATSLRLIIFEPLSRSPTSKLKQSYVPISFYSKYLYFRDRFYMSSFSTRVKLPFEEK